MKSWWRRWWWRVSLLTTMWFLWLWLAAYTFAFWFLAGGLPGDDENHIPEKLGLIAATLVAFVAASWLTHLIVRRKS